MNQKAFLAIFVIVIVAVFGYFIFGFSQFQAKVMTVTVPDAKLAYYVRGEGKPLILLGGLGMTMAQWDPLLLEDLSKSNKVIILDYRGVGNSTGDLSHVTQKQLAIDVIAVMDNLKIAKANVLGWSLGSFVGQTVAASYPDRVDKLILVSTAPGGGKTVEASDSVSNAIQNNFGGSWETIYVPFLFYSDEAGKNYLRRLEIAQVDKIIPTAPEETLAAKNAYEQATSNTEDDTQRYLSLPKITTPTLLITGEEDELLVPENAKRVNALIPHSELKLVPEAGHAVLFEKPHETNRLIEEFLRKI